MLELQANEGHILNIMKHKPREEKCACLFVRVKESLSNHREPRPQSALNLLSNSRTSTVLTCTHTQVYPHSWADRQTRIKTGRYRLKSNTHRVHGEYQHLQTAGPLSVFFWDFKHRNLCKTISWIWRDCSLKWVKSFSLRRTALPLHGAVKIWCQKRKKNYGKCRKKAWCMWTALAFKSEGQPGALRPPRKRSRLWCPVK